MRRLLASAILVLVTPCALAQPSPRWTFCVAAPHEGRDVWISEVFVATRERETFEGEMKAYFQHHDGLNVDVQCPEAKDDKTAVVNAQFAAIEFNRKLGNRLHEVAASAFVSKR